MVAAGCLYIKSGEALVKEVLRDLVEMCKGVQHPTQGLFLRRCTLAFAHTHTHTHVGGVYVCF